MENKEEPIFQTVDKFRDLSECDIDKKEAAFLKYVVLVANHFFPDFELVDDSENGILLPSVLPREFKVAYNKQKLNHTFTVESYVRNREIQKLLKELKLNRRRFWYLLLFVYNYCYNRYMIGVKVAKTSSKVQLEEALQYLKDNMETDIVLAIGKNGKEPVIKVRDKIAIRELINWDAHIYAETRTIYLDEQVKESVNKFAYHFDKYISWLITDLQKQREKKSQHAKPIKGIGRKTIFLVENLLEFTGIKCLDDMITKHPLDRPRKMALIGWMTGIRERYKDSRDDNVSRNFYY